MMLGRLVRRAALMLLLIGTSSALTACGGGEGGGSNTAAAATATSGTSSSSSNGSTGVNRAPSLSGSPATSVTVGSTYSFVPAANDADGNQLSFSIVNRPSWATFNTVTGALTGVPTETGSFSNIVITVSDGQSSAALPSFNIAVTAALPTGSATISWLPPTQNTDGSALTDLAGYVIFYGTGPDNLATSVGINSADATSYTIDGLPGGATYYFAVSSVNADGVFSDFSAVASKTI